MKRLITFLSLICLSVAARSQQWYPLGGDVNNQPSLNWVDKFDMALAPNGYKYLAFKDNINGGKLTIRRHNGIKWEAVGNPAISDDEVGDIEIVISKSGTPFVVFDEVSNAGYPRVKKFNGISWVNVGSNITNGGFNPSVFSIALDTFDNPYVAYINGNSSEIEVVKYVNNSWSLLGTSSGMQIGIYCLDMAIGPNNKPYVAYCSTPYAQPAVQTWNGTAWTAVGAAAIPSTGINDIKIKFAKAGYPVIAFNDASVSEPIVKKYDGSSWVSQGGLPSIYPMYNIDLNLDTADNPIVGYKYGSNGEDSISIQHYDGTAWQQLHQVATQQFGFVITAVDSSNALYACYSDTMRNPKLSLSTANGLVDMSGDTGIPDMNNAVQDIAADSTGNVYLVSNKGNRLGFWHYNGYSWNMLDTAGAPAAGSTLGNIAVDKTGMLHVSYIDAAANYKVTVKKYTAGGWATVGTAGFSPNGNKGYIQFDTANIPYVAYGDPYYYSSIFVKKYDGSSWTDVGINGQAATGYLRKNSFVIDHNNNLYIASQNLLSQLSPISMFNGTSWNNYLGSNSGINYMTDPALVVDASGMLYLFYSLQGNGVKYHTYNGTAWWGPAYVSNTFGTDHYAGVLNGNTPVVAYSELDTMRSDIMKYNGSTWSAVAPATYGGDGSTNTVMNVVGNKIFAATTNTKGYTFARVYTTPAPICTTNTWTGYAGNGLWNTPGNWSCGVVPALSQDVIIPSGASITISNNAECNNLTVSAGASISFLGSNPILHVLGSMNNNGTINTAGGTLQVDNP